MNTLALQHTDQVQYGSFSIKRTSTSITLTRSCYISYIRLISSYIKKIGEQDV